MSNTVSAFRSLVAVITAADSGDVSTTQNRIQEARSSVQKLDAKRSAEYEALLAKLERAVVENAAKAAQSRLDTLRARLAAIKEPVALEAVAREVAGWTREVRARSGSEQENWGQLAAQLSMLAAAWSAASPVLLQQDRQMDWEAARASYAGEVRSLRKRIERDVLGRTLRLPELNNAPLNEKPTEEALDALSNDLAGRSEWRRLYQLLEARAGLQGLAGRIGQDDALPALRSFFAAQNLELAEQWTDAVQAYKAVLQAVSERAPIKAAAERLKALTKEHPEAFTPATPNAVRRSSAPELER
ncbi:MAG: hypothetical protein QOE70_2162 [Chthoniobacter sp.]|nr:hypothetical protein [Chthoniobacter sp.]